jgi:hypothetical protein
MLIQIVFPKQTIIIDTQKITLNSVKDLRELCANLFLEETLSANIKFDFTKGNIKKTELTTILSDSLPHSDERVVIYAKAAINCPTADAIEELSERCSTTVLRKALAAKNSSNLPAKLNRAIASKAGELTAFFDSERPSRPAAAPKFYLSDVVAELDASTESDASSVTLPGSVVSSRSS